MAFMTLSLALTLVVPAALPADVMPLNKKSFKIPININPNRQQEIRELLLFASPDEGETWQQVAVATPDREFFSFYAKEDGRYWFTVMVVDDQGNRTPPSISQAPPGLKVEVDTRKPVFQRFTVERQGDEVVVEWDIDEVNLSLEQGAFQLEYREAGGDGTWTTALVNAASRGRTSIRHPGPTGLVVQMQVRDQAQNTARVSREVGPGSGPAPLPGPVAQAAQPSLDRTSFSSAPPPAPAPASYDPPPPGPEAFGSAVPGTMHAPPAAAAAAYVPPPPPVPPTGYPLAGTDAAGPQPIAVGGGGPSSFVPPPAAAGATSQGLPPMLITNQKKFGMDYEVTQAGPSGVGAIELYISPDNGTAWNWKLATVHRDLSQPIPVDLPHEGIFGFRMVLKNNVGLGDEPPRPGDPPEVRIEYDHTLPFAMLYPAEHDSARPNVLTIIWKASDRNLAANPITLEWSMDPRNGDWKPIGPRELPNSGRYNWEVSPDVPHHVYLRLLVRDTAGNVTQAVTREPIKVDLFKPRGSLKGIAAIVH